MSSLRVIGPGRAGTALASALAGAGWQVDGPLGRNDSIRQAAAGVDLLVVAVPDDAVARVAEQVEPVSSTVVAHLAGSLGLDVLDPHERRASLHPLVALPDPTVGAKRLSSGVWFAVAGDPYVEDVVAALGGRWFAVPDEHRAAYHAAAVIASNHLVAVLGQAERVARGAGVPFEAFHPLIRSTVDNVVELGPAPALTGPAARGDEATLGRHRAALEAAERPLYDALATEAARLAGRGTPEP
jgi:predicted short-subunit dehydrogenase-like oxidoreductase (DUF2520 family)